MRPSILELRAASPGGRAFRGTTVWRAQSALKTLSGGEFDWGGTSVKRKLLLKAELNLYFLKKKNACSIFHPYMYTPGCSPKRGGGGEQ